MLSPVISRFQAQPLLNARRLGVGEASTSIDLGLTTCSALLGADGITLDGGRTVSWQALEEIAGDEGGCFVIEDSAGGRIQCFSEETNRAYSLWATAGAPTMLVSGVTMHRIKGIDPLEDTRRKLRTIEPVSGRVLDTATGLGYTAIEASRTAREVVTIELDPAALEIARLNPWSRGLFESAKIRQVVWDSFSLVQSLEDGGFSRVIHDPPAMRLAGELYSLEFYRQLHRVLEEGARLFHYVGDPASKSGARVTAGVMRRLGEAGFREVRRCPEAYGVSARR